MDVPSCRLALLVVCRGSTPVRKAPAGLACAPEAPVRELAPVLSSPLSTSSCRRWASSGLNVGVSSKALPSAAGVQCSMMMPFGTYTVQKRGTGRAGVFASAVSAGTIPSSNGNASVAPTPRSTVRRGMAFLAIIMIPTSASGRECSWRRRQSGTTR